jgi:hypothetical protein
MNNLFRISALVLVAQASERKNKTLAGCSFDLNE